MVYLSIHASSDTEDDPAHELERDENSGHIPRDDEPAVNLIVGGSYFSMTVGIIKRFPDSYFARAIKAWWKASDGEPLIIDRDGRLFKYVLEHMCGWDSTFGTRSLEWVLLLRHEADFFNIATLVSSCDGQITRRLMDKCWEETETLGLLKPCVSSPSERTNQVLSQLFPRCFTGSVDVSSLSSAFFEAINANMMQIPLVSRHTTIVQLYMDPILELSEYNNTVLISILKATPPVPDIPLYARNVTVMTAVPARMPNQHPETVATVYCILQVSYLTYSFLLLPINQLFNSSRPWAMPC